MPNNEDNINDAEGSDVKAEGSDQKAEGSDVTAEGSDVKAEGSITEESKLSQEEAEPVQSSEGADGSTDAAEEADAKADNAIDALEVVLESFEGPLDLLLYLIRKQNLDILNIPVADITRQYMGYVELMRSANLDLAAEYLVMAALLGEIKSRMLLPKPKTEEEDEEDPMAALIRRLQEYERFTEAARQLDERPRLDRDIYQSHAVFEDVNPPVVEAQITLQQLVNS